MAGYVIAPEVIPQARDMPMGCWIAGLAMIYNYKYPVPGKSQWELAQEGGAEFELYYSEGLPSSADPDIDKYGLLISTYRLFGLPPQTYTLDGWVDFLQRFGPLCVIVDADAPNNRLNHLVVMQGIEWTNGFSDAWFHLVDAANGNSGMLRADAFRAILETPDAVDLTTFKGFAMP